jgi:hypothetical protein
MVALQSSDSFGDRPPGHQGSRHEARIPAMVSSSDLPSAYDPFASVQQANTLPISPNIASRRGGGQVSSNIGSFQSIDQTLLADYMRQAQEVSRVFSLFQQEMRTHSQPSLIHRLQRQPGFQLQIRNTSAHHSIPISSISDPTQAPTLLGQAHTILPGRASTSGTRFPLPWLPCLATSPLAPSIHPRPTPAVFPGASHRSQASPLSTAPMATIPP